MILDTNAVSAILTGDRGIARLLAPVDYPHLPWIVVGEYEFGLMGSRHRKRLERLFQKLEAESVVLYADRETVATYARVRHELKQAGTPIPENDVWIAAVVRQYDLPLVSNDPHFDSVPGIQRRSW
jgi:predicted nucleic acid-binding protein